MPYVTLPLLAVNSRCDVAGIDVRTLQRWSARAGLPLSKRRLQPCAVRVLPSHSLSPTERAALLAVASMARFASTPPAHIVPMRAHEGEYLGSKFSMARLLKAAGQNKRTVRAKVPRVQQILREGYRTWAFSVGI
jgi:hypothetical protein